jgi:type IV secretion system protein VirB10
MSLRPEPGDFFRSPTSVAPKARYLTKAPLLIVLGIGGAALSVLAYTTYQRAHHGDVKQGQLPSTETANADDILAGMPDRGGIAARSSGLPQAPGKPGRSEPNPAPPPSLTATSPAQLTPEQMAAKTAWTQYATARADHQKAQQLALEQALAAAPAVTLHPNPQQTSRVAGPDAATPALPSSAFPRPANPASGESGTAFGTGGFGSLGGADGNTNIAGLSAPQDPNGQSEKLAFANRQAIPADTLNATRVPLSTPYEIRAGAVIPGIMISGINSDLPGEIIGQVSESVYDTATGQLLLIPQGSRLVGKYDSRVTYGQGRVLVVWDRLIYPDGSSLDLHSMPGADEAGYAGMEDEVDNHYLRIFGSALVMSVIGAGVQLSQPQATNGENISSSQIIAGSLGQQLGQAGMAVTQKNLGIAPTIQIRPGYLFNIMVVRDILLPGPWQP